MSNFDSFNRNALFKNVKASSTKSMTVNDKVNRTSLENVRENMYKIDVNKMPKPKEAPQVKTTDSIGNINNMKSVNLNNPFNIKKW